MGYDKTVTNQTKGMFQLANPGTILIP